MSPEHPEWWVTECGYTREQAEAAAARYRYESECGWLGQPYDCHRESSDD